MVQTFNLSKEYEDDELTKFISTDALKTILSELMSVTAQKLFLVREELARIWSRITHLEKNT